MSGSKVDVKIVLLGDAHSGKTSLLERYLHNCFADKPYQNTIGAAYGAKKVEVYGRPLVLGIWDTAGSERYHSMAKIYYRGAHAAILCYDTTDDDSFAHIRYWCEQLRHNETDTQLYFVGCKCDLAQEDVSCKKVDFYMVTDFAQQYIPAHINAVERCYETSAKHGDNVSELFTHIAKDYVLRQRDSLINSQHHDDAFQLGAEKKSRQCCTLI